MAKFDYEGAKKAGYSDEEILKSLSSKHPSFKSQEAIKAGYSPQEVVQFLSSYEKPQPDQRSVGERVKAGAQQYGVGAAGGVGGAPIDILNLAKSAFGGILGSQLPDIPSGTHDLTEKIEKEFDVNKPVDSLERILKQSGEWGGQEGLFGTAVGGPVGGGLGLAHGSASGALYGGLKEMGWPDELALAATMIATVSPIAAQKLLPKIEQKVASLKQGGRKPPPAPGSTPPPPPGSSAGQFPFKGEKAPTGNTTFELAEDALQKLQQPVSAQQGITSKVKETPISESISPDKFFNEKHGGIELAGRVKKQAKLQKEPVTKKYKEAEKVYSGQSDIFPQLSSKVDRLIESMGESAKLNTGEKAVLDQLNALKGILGDTVSGLKEVSLKRLIKTADSMSGLANYEMPFTGPKDLLKKVVKDLNENVISSLEKKGLNASAMKQADKAYSQWASKFLNDEISPFLERRILNPESRFRKAVSDEGSYRAVKQALGDLDKRALERLDRHVVDERMKDYYKDHFKIQSPQFSQDIANLEGLIGKEKANKMKGALQKRPISSEYAGKSPEDLLNLMNTRTGIRKLREDMKKAGLSDVFDKIAEQKTLEILKGGVVSPEKITGKLLFENIRKPKNYDILSEIYGKEAVNAALADAAKSESKRMALDKFFKLAKLAGQVVGASKLIKVISILV